MATELDKAIASARERWAGAHEGAGAREGAGVWAGATPDDLPADFSETDLGGATPARAVGNGRNPTNMKNNEIVSEPKRPSLLSEAMARVDATPQPTAGPAMPKPVPPPTPDDYSEGYRHGYDKGRADGYREALEVTEWITSAGFQISRRK
jgi:hypothetical protein